MVIRITRRNSWNTYDKLVGIHRFRDNDKADDRTQEHTVEDIGVHRLVIGPRMAPQHFILGGTTGTRGGIKVVSENNVKERFGIVLTTHKRGKEFDSELPLSRSPSYERATHLCL